MKSHGKLSGIALLLAVLFLSMISLPAHAIPSAFSPQEAAPPTGQTPGEQAPGEGQRMPLFGKITALHDSSIEIAVPTGDTVTVSITGKTEFRKDRQAAKRSDFKVGDVVVVRGEEKPDHTWTAEVIGARSMNGSSGPGRGGPGGGNRGELGAAGTLGKDYVAGEIKSVDAPKLSVLRSDNVTQTMELNEETSLRKGRESITMADIQVGDHLFARGGLQNDVFVPKVVVVIGPEQWKRMQEWGGQTGGQRRPPSAPGNPGSDTPKPPEPRH